MSFNIRVDHHGAPGDWLCITAATHSMWKHHPYLRFKLNTCCPEIFRNAPWECQEARFDKTIKIDYGPQRTEVDHADRRFIPSFFQDLQAKLGLPAKLEVWAPQIFLTREEIEAVPFKQPYCVICSGWKQDYQIKNWGFSNWQEVVDWIRQDLKIDVIQVGELNGTWHVHKPLQGAIDHLGKTKTRELFALAYKAQFGLGHESYLHHIFASSFHAEGREQKGKPFICAASGWNPKHWCSYNTEVYLCSQGRLDCCAFGGCNKAKIRDCVHPEKVGDELVGRCMSMITPDEVIKAIKDYKNGGLIN